MRKHIFYRWASLSEEDKKDNLLKTQALFDFCENNPNVTVTYDQMNKVGINHLYKFLVDEYNTYSPHEMQVDKYGCTCIF